MRSSLILFMTIVLVYVIPPAVVFFGLRELSEGQKTFVTIALMFVMNFAVKAFVRKRWGADVPHI